MTGMAHEAIESEDRDGDLSLVRAITEGSQNAWEEFVGRYSPLIYATISKSIYSKEDATTVYVSTLERLAGDRLSTYEGRSSLATWLILVARNAALDFLRHSRGRFRIPVNVTHLGELDREIYRLYFVEGYELGEVRELLKPGFGEVETDDILSAIERIDAAIDKRVLRRLAYDRHARKLGVESGRLLEYMEQLRFDLEQRSSSIGPESRIMTRELDLLKEKVCQHVQQLSSEDRRVIELRYERGYSAKEITAELGLKGERKAFTLLERSLRRLRAVLDQEGTNRDFETFGER